MTIAKSPQKAPIAKRGLHRAQTVLPRKDIQNTIDFFSIAQTCGGITKEENKEGQAKSDK